MGIISEFRLKNSCKKEGRIKEYEEYKKCIESLESDIVRYTRYLNDATNKFADIKQRFTENSKEYNNAKDEVYRWQHTLEERKLELKFVRPNSQQDIEYRENECKNFVNKLQKIISPNLDLRFHGTPIYFAEQIIKSGTISSTADRYDGYIKSTDMKGEISASTVETLGRTINFFSDMVAYQRSLPAGCIFAILPKDNEDATYGQDLMHSVNFRENSRQLFGVFTTPENIENVKKWMHESGFNSNIVWTFEEFLQVVDEKSNNLNNKNINPFKENIKRAAIKEVEDKPSETVNYKEIGGNTDDRSIGE